MIVLFIIVIGLLLSGVLGWLLISFAYCLWHGCKFKELWDFSDIESEKE